ncbi:MAG TPA: hypothetical protein PLB22_11975, partial [Ottowia sp.]|nr:hypothetical protein [Ottowia sp.]
MCIQIAAGAGHRDTSGRGKNPPFTRRDPLLRAQPCGVARPFKEHPMSAPIRIAIAGHGNLGRGVEAAITRNP